MHLNYCFKKDMGKFGPGLIITAAFIGPGTITTATLTGAGFGYALTWALLLSVIITFVLQEMAARLGVITGKGLAENLRQTVPKGIVRLLTLALVVIAIGVGNAAYEAGNLTGAAIGVSNLLGGDVSLWAAALGITAGVILYFGGLNATKWLLLGLVLLMSLVFVVTMFVSGVNFQQLFRGLFSFSVPKDGLLTTIAIIGTTVVPYNLFLHTSLAKDYQSDLQTSQRISLLRKDAIIAIVVGGLISLAVMSTAAITFFGNATQPNINNISEQLQPLLGDFAPLLFALGLFAAGLTSAITAPLAAGFAVCGALGWSTTMTDYRFKVVTFSILIIGTLLCFLQLKPLQIILLAQVANGLLLPVLALFLLWMVNQRSLMKDATNSLLHNFFALSMVMIVAALGIFKIISVF